MFITSISHKLILIFPQTIESEINTKTLDTFGYCYKQIG